MKRKIRHIFDTIYKKVEKSTPRIQKLGREGSSYSKINLITHMEETQGRLSTIRHFIASTLYKIYYRGLNLYNKIESNIKKSEDCDRGIPKYTVDPQLVEQVITHIYPNTTATPGASETTLTDRSGK